MTTPRVPLPVVVLALLLPLSAAHRFRYTTTNTTTSSSSSRKLQFDAQCESLAPVDPAQTHLYLSEGFLTEKAKVILDLAFLVNQEESGDLDAAIAGSQTDYDGLYGWTDNLDDQAIVAKKHEHCFAVFQATEGNNLLDQLQNLNPFPTRIADSDCFARQGFHSAYFAPYYYDFRSTLEECLASCIGDTSPCPLILGGNSQGGAAAVIASIDLQQHNPRVITFGAPRAILQSNPCTDVEPLHHIRFLTTHPTLGYDAVAFQFNLFRERHVGYPLFLDEVGDNWPLASPNFEINQVRTPTDRSIHERTIYQERIDAMMERGCFPIPVARWPQDHYCFYDDECMSRECRPDNTCSIPTIPVN